MLEKQHNIWYMKIYQPNKHIQEEKWAWYYICLWLRFYFFSTLLQLIPQFPSCEETARAVFVNVFLPSMACTLCLQSIEGLPSFAHRKFSLFQCAVWHTCLETKNGSCLSHFYIWINLKDDKLFSLIPWYEDMGQRSQLLIQILFWKNKLWLLLK